MSEQRIARTSRPGRTLEIGRIWSQKRRTGKGEELETDGMHCNIHLCRPSVRLFFADHGRQSGASRGGKVELLEKN